LVFRTRGKGEPIWGTHEETAITSPGYASIGSVIRRCEINLTNSGIPLNDALAALGAGVKFHQE
jgi:hypothetical protein